MRRLRRSTGWRELPADFAHHFLYDLRLYRDQNDVRSLDCGLVIGTDLDIQLRGERLRAFFMLHGGASKVGESRLFLSSAWSRIPPILPVPRNATRFSRSSSPITVPLPNQEGFASQSTVTRFYRMPEAACGRCSIHFQAVETISRRVRLAFHCKRVSARRGSATNAGGSPGRRGQRRSGTGLPVTSSTMAMTSRTEWPRPVPKFAAKDSLPACR